MILKKAQISKFQKRLEDLRDGITHSLKGTNAEVKSPETAKGYSQHQADEGTDDFDRTITLELSNNDYAILRQIERALTKISEGTYGVCDVTGEPIPIARLEAVPYANMTVSAQEKVEKGLL